MRSLLPVPLAILVVAAPVLSAQALRLDGSAKAVAVGIVADPVPYGAEGTQFGISQTTLGARIGLGRFAVVTEFNFESLTLPGGELTPGGWGEGYVDRRHPHTTVHELLVTGRDLLGGIDGSGELGAFAGKGFVPFGTDDPMSRPFHSFPVNHHLSQILERAVLGLQYRLAPLTVEAALMNGDEPERASQWPMIRLPDGKWRFGDSWSLRVTAAPWHGSEFQVSMADVHSPEHRLGAGGTARKYSASGRIQRFDPDRDRSRYLLAEWARTEELDGFFVFGTLLAEFEERRGAWGAGYRFERTNRPEEERLMDPYRSLRPHLENSILGRTRWTLHTVRVSREIGAGSGVRLVPFVEGTFGTVRKDGSGIFDVTGIYGGTGVRHLRAGLMFDWNGRGHRMGRYGVLDDHAGH